MKSALAILFSVALVLTPGLNLFSAASGDAVPPPEQCCCGNGKLCCAAKAQSENTPTAPALPAPAGSSTSQQIAPPSNCSVGILADFSSTKLFFTSPPVRLVGAVALYQQNCAYLI